MHYKIPPVIIPKPNKLEEMISISERLSKGINFCRIDLFYNQETILFGEITISAVAGYAEFKPDKFDLIFGQLIDTQA